MDGGGPDDEHEHAEGCLCGVELSDDDLTLDSELPEALGGVEAAPEEHAEDADGDGCDLDFTLAATVDEDLPTAWGGTGR